MKHLVPGLSVLIFAGSLCLPAFCQEVAKPDKQTAPNQASVKRQLSQARIFALLASGIPNQRIVVLIQKLGIDFEPTADYLQEVRLAGGDDDLIRALKGTTTAPAKQIDLTVNKYNGQECDVSIQYMKDFLEGGNVHTSFDDNDGQQKLEFFLEGAYGSEIGGNKYSTFAWSLTRYPDKVIASGKENTVEDCLRAVKSSLVKYQSSSEYLDPAFAPNGSDDANRKLAETHMEACNEKYDHQNWDGAITECRFVVHLNPNHLEAHTVLPGLCTDFA
jgi:hypothetical protein